MRAAALSLLIPCSALLLFACGPGGGGGGGSICFQDPSYPGCQQAGQDTTGGDTQTTQPDAVDQPDTTVTPDTTGTLDTVGPDDDVKQPPADTTQPDSTEGCAPLGGTRCSGDAVEACDGTAWMQIQVCPAGTCFNGACGDVCEAECTGKECGPDGCGGLCGSCPNGWSCVEGTCQDECVPSCAGMECGSDGCGGTCGSCFEGAVCEGGECIEQCVPDCAGRECGSDGCGGTCGSCFGSESCQGGQCIAGCVPSCSGKECGADGCGGSCGTCFGGDVCSLGQCTGGGTGLDCPGIIDCVNGCADEPCMQACVEQGSPTGESEFIALNGCYTEYGCQDALCAAENCSYQNAKCTFDAAGSGTCNGILECQQGCTQGDSACVVACYDAASVNAQASLIALNQCVGYYCPSSDQTCVQASVQDPDQCGAFASACFGG